MSPCFGGWRKRRHWAGGVEEGAAVPRTAPALAEAAPALLSLCGLLSQLGGWAARLRLGGRKIRGLSGFCSLLFTAWLWGPVCLESGGPGFKSWPPWQGKGSPLSPGVLNQGGLILRLVSPSGKAQKCSFPPRVPGAKADVESRVGVPVFAIQSGWALGRFLLGQR